MNSSLAERIASIASAQGLTVAVAESLTGGAIASELAAAPNASDWFAGGVVAYSSNVKFDLLGVTPGPVVTEQCAVEMAQGGVRLLAVDAAVAATGVGGPDPDEGKDAGTVWIAVAGTGDKKTSRLHNFSGEPDEVVSKAVTACLELLAEFIDD